jgi:hypothetical protein
MSGVENDQWTRVNLADGKYVLVEFAAPGVLSLATLVRRPGEDSSGFAENVDLGRSDLAELVRVLQYALAATEPTFRHLEAINEQEGI